MIFVCKASAKDTANEKCQDFNRGDLFERGLTDGETVTHYWASTNDQYAAKTVELLAEEISAGDVTTYDIPYEDVLAELNLVPCNPA
jgi:hypothetical protein